jgi:hypothetical protein
MTLREQLVLLADSYAAIKGLARATVSDRVLNAGHVLDRLAAGRADITTATLERAVLWFDANWPEDNPWPVDLARPSLAADARHKEAA